MPWELYKAYGDTELLEAMYPTIVKQLEFYTASTNASNGLLYPWTASQWDFLGDWITPHGSETKVTSPENLLFNNCYLRYITVLTSKIASTLGKDSDAKEYAAAADALAIAINRAFLNASSGVYLTKPMQTWQVMPLAAGVVPDAAMDLAYTALEQSINVIQAGHLDTGLTGTYFMTKLLTESNRNDLLFTMANQTTFPSYGYFLEQGYTTWPEDWNAKGGASSSVSKMHGCYNAIGLWFLQGIAGISVDASDPSYPITIRAGITSGDIREASGARFALHGPASSSWSVTTSSFTHNLTIPANSIAKVMVPTASKKGTDVLEAGKPVLSRSVTGVKVIGVETLQGINYLVMSVGSGSYYFTSQWAKP